MKRVIFLIASIALCGTDELIEAARKGDVATVKAELDKGTDVNAKWRYDQTALFIAVRRGHSDLVRLLLDRGATLTVKDSYYGMTALNSATSEGHSEVVRMLVENGAEGKEAAFLTAVGAGKAEVVKVLLASGGFTPETLTKALSAGQKHPEVVAQLKQAGAVPLTIVTVDPMVLSRYSGNYKGDNVEVRFDVKEGKLIATLGTQRLECSAIDEKTFVPIGLEHVYKVVFLTEGEKVTAFDLHQGTNITKVTRVEGK